MTKYLEPEALIEELNEVVDRHNAMAADFLRCLVSSTRQLALWRKKAEQFDALLDESNRLLYLAQNAQAWRDENVHLWRVIANLDTELHHYETLAAAPADFATLWRLYQAQDMSNRSDPVDDRAFWATHAPSYDAVHDGCPHTIKTLLDLAQPTDTVLDVGAGTGRFALPLAQHVQQVTALDDSPAMLEILRQKAGQGQTHNLITLEAAWEEAEVEPHDLVLAARSLYRQPDLLAALRKLVAATRRILVIVESDDDAPHNPHHPFITEIWGEQKPGNLPKYLCILGALWQIGVRAEVKIVYETRCLHGLIPETIAGQLAPTGATPAQITELADRLQSLLQHEAEGWSYNFTYPVEILIWHKERI